MATAATSTVSRNESMNRMGANVRRDRSAFHPQRDPSRKLRVASTALRCSEALAQKKLYGDTAVAEQTAALVDAFLNVGDVETVARIMQPIDAALIGREVPHYSVLEHEDDLLDALEDVKQSAWRETRSDAALDDYINKLAHAAYKAQEHLASLKQEQKRRREEKQQ